MLILPVLVMQCDLGRLKIEELKIFKNARLYDALGVMRIIW